MLVDIINDCCKFTTSFYKIAFDFKTQFVKLQSSTG